LIKRIKSSLTFKIFLITSILLLTICGITYGFLAFAVPKIWYSSINEKVIEETEGLIEQLKDVKFNESLDILDQFRTANDIQISILDSDGQWNDLRTVILSDQYERDPKQHSEMIAEMFPKNSRIGSLLFYDSENYVRIYSVVFAGNEEHALIFNGNVLQVNQVTEVLDEILPWLLLILAIVSVLGAVLYSFYITKPIVKLSKASEKMEALDFSWQLDTARTDEIGILTSNLSQLANRLSAALRELQSFNEMLQDDVKKEKEQKQKQMDFFSAVSHELKTPITVIKGQLEGMIDNVGVYQNHDRYLNRSFMVACQMEEIVKELLMVARMASSDFDLKPEDIDFSALVHDCIKDHEDLSIGKEMIISSQIEEGLLLLGNRKLLLKVLNNVMNNAIHHSPNGSLVYVHTYKEDGKFIFSVENTGVQIPKNELPKLFGAFYRIEKSRNRSTGGTGLGLYIVKMILDMYLGEYMIENTKQGVLFTIRLNISN